MTVRFQFNERKGIEALAYIASKMPNASAFYASKVLFYAEKMHLSRYARPIVADTFIAMPNGPVPSTLYDFIQGNLGQAGDPEAVNAAIDRSAYPRIKARREPDLAVLSESDVEALDEAIAYCRSKGFQHLSTLTHQEASWREADTNGPMDYELFVDAEYPNREAILEDAREFALFGVL